VVVTISVTGDHCARARIALTGLSSAPARVLEAEARLEGSALREQDIARCLEQIEQRAPFRDDAHASADYRRALASVLTRRALGHALERARAGEPRSAAAAEARPVHARAPLPYFTTGDVLVTLNGQRRHLAVEARTTLMQALRDAGCQSVKHGCETGECGACAVLVDGRPLNSCITLALQAQGRRVTTVEGLGTPDALHPLQQAFVDTGAVQCGYCTPAMELCAKALLDATPAPSETEVREALAGCLCRCTGYVKPVQAVLQAAQALRDER
jgi:aerobic-type carbon monoxide dehydrogenase small subunit (CoxS/CutS family)